jgi:hypothetical protein
MEKSDPYPVLTGVLSEMFVGEEVHKPWAQSG